MIEMPQLPQLSHAARIFVSFAALLRANGFAIAPEQTTAFLEAITLLGPRGPEDIRQAGLATLAPLPERRGAYDLLFRIHFLGGEEIAGAAAEDDDVVRLQEEGHGDEEQNQERQGLAQPRHSHAAQSGSQHKTISFHVMIP